MNDLFIPNMMMSMTAQNQMMWQQHIDMESLTMNHHGYSYANSPPQEDIIDNFSYPHSIRDISYAGNDFGYVEKPPLFDDREIIDIKNDKIICYIKVKIIDETGVVIQCEIKKGYMYEEDVAELIKKQIYSAIKSGHSTIQAEIGRGDEIAEEILGKLGFQNVINDVKTSEE